MTFKIKSISLLIIGLTSASCTSTAKPITVEQSDPMTLDGGNVHGPGEGFNGWPCNDGSRVIKKSDCPPPRPADAGWIDCWDGTIVFNRADCPLRPKPALEEDTTPSPNTIIVSETATCEDDDQCSPKVKTKPEPELHSIQFCWNGLVVENMNECPIDNGPPY